MVREMTTVVVGVAALAAYFRAVRTEWPHAYFPAGRRLETQLSQDPFRFALYRFLPVAVVSAIAGATLEKVARPTVVPMLALGFLHAVVTSGRGVWVAARRLDGPISVTRGIAHAVIGLGCVAASAVAIPLTPVLSHHVPKTDQLVAALWTAGFAALAGAWLLSLTRGDHDPSLAREATFRKARQTIGDELWARAAEVAREVDADERLVRAVLIVENVQRPFWLRRMESLAGRLTSSGTFGPLQVRGVPTGARELQLLDEAIRQRFAGQRFLDPHGGTDHRWRELFFRSYNDDPQWREDAEAAYSWLDYGGSTALAWSESVADDGLPQIEVTRVSDTTDQVTIEGTALPADPSIVLVQWSQSAGELHKDTLSIAGVEQHRQKWEWKALRDPAATTIVVRKPTAGEQLRLGDGTPNENPILEPQPWTSEDDHEWSPIEDIGEFMAEGGVSPDGHPAWDADAEQPVDSIAIPIRPSQRMEQTPSHASTSILTRFRNWLRRRRTR